VAAAAPVVTLAPAVLVALVVVVLVAHRMAALEQQELPILAAVVARALPESRQRQFTTAATAALGRSCFATPTAMTLRLRLLALPQSPFPVAGASMNLTLPVRLRSEVAMAHFAKVVDGRVERVVVVANAELLDNGTESEAKGAAFCADLFGPGQWVQCSYNANVRGRFPGPGTIYNAEKDRFEQPQPYPSWLFDEQTLGWYPPVPAPRAAGGVFWRWDEPTLTWVGVDN
jgi:hypothetical protein